MICLKCKGYFREERYFEGGMPAYFLKKRVKCWGYSNPSSWATCVTDIPPIMRLLARSMRKR